MSDETKANNEVPPNEGDAPVKTAKQLEKEAKKAAKLAKLQEKLEKKAAVAETTKEVSAIYFILVCSRKLFKRCDVFCVFI